MKMLAIITGTRPEIIKMFPIMRQLDKDKIEYKYIHTGQHYDSALSFQFFEELGTRHPDYYIDLDRSKNTKLQVMEITQKLINIFKKESFSSVLVQGDTNSTLASALAAYKVKIPIYHVEAGLRCFDISMQEEVNRIIVDKISDVLFVPTEDSRSNLLNENIKGKIFVVGNTVMDAIKIITANNNRHKKITDNQFTGKKTTSTRQQKIPEKGDYVLITLHRAENIKNRNFLVDVFTSLKNSGLSFIFPMHPHTIKQIKNHSIEYLLEYKNIKIVPPAGYNEFLNLIKGSRFVITDSGGLQEEITSKFLNKHAIILRPNTERPESVRSGHSILLKNFSIESLTAEINSLDNKVGRESELYFFPNASPYGEGDSSKKIVDIIKILQIKPLEIMN